MNRAKPFLVLVALAIGAAAPLAAWVYSRRPALQVAGALGLKTAPPSLDGVQCKDWGFTDVLVTCSFRLDARDFRTLLRGLHWKTQSAIGGSYRYGSGPHVGREFPVATEFDATPRDAPPGGLVRLVTDASRTHAQVDLYIE